MPSTMTQSVRCWKHCNKAAHVAGWSPNLMRMKASTRWTKALPSATYGDRLIRALVVLDAALGDLVALLTEPQQGDGSAGEAAAQPVLIMAEAGTGKSWMTK